MNMKPAVLAVSVILFATQGIAQEVQDEAIPVIPRELGLFVDGVHNMQSSSSSISISIANGVKTIDAVEGELKAHIEEDTEDGTISMTITRTYGPDDHEELMRTQPELYMHLKAMPTEVGDSTFEISVGVTKKYEADDAEDLEERHPEAYQVYKKFSDPRAAQMPQLRMLSPRMIRPAMPVRPIEVIPGGIRIHEDDEDDKEKESDKENDKSGDDEDGR